MVDLLIQKRLGVVGRTFEILDLDLDGLQAAGSDGGGSPGAKYQSLWPLPGGDYLAALNAMVEYIGTQSPTYDAMIEWIKLKFPSVQSSKVATSYTNVLRYAGLVAYEGSQLMVTELGATYLADQSRDYLLDLFCARFVGMEELLDLLRKSPGTLEELHEALLKRINVQWSTPHQSRFRLEWLRALGAADRNAAGVWSAID